MNEDVEITKEDLANNDWLICFILDSESNEIVLRAGSYTYNGDTRVEILGSVLYVELEDIIAVYKTKEKCFEAFKKVLAYAFKSLSKD